jgi:hypothetical protein
MYATNIKPLIILEKHIMFCFFFLHYIPYKENKCWENFKIKRKSLLNFLSYSHPKIWKFQGVTEDKDAEFVLDSLYPNPITRTSSQQETCPSIRLHLLPPAAAGEHTLIVLLTPKHGKGRLGPGRPVRPGPGVV